MRDLRQAREALTWPAVLKPVDSGGQRGLFRVESLQEAEAKLPEALALSRSGRAILESHVEGAELNGLLVVRDGEPFLLTLSDRLRPDGPGFGVGWIHLFPSALPAAVLDRARDVAFAAVAALGLRDGIAFPQLIANKRGEVSVVEVAARIPAGQMADLVSYGIGVNLFEVAIACAIGEPVTDAMISPRFRRPVAIRFYTSTPGHLPAGTVRAIDGLADVRASPGVLTADLYFGMGETIRPVQVDADRRGYVVATAATAEAALGAADAAAEKLRVTVDAKPIPELQPSRSGRPVWRLAPAALVLLVLAATAIAFMVAEAGKLEKPILTATRVDKQFSPTCHCSQDVARLAFRLLRRTPIILRVVNATGQPVKTLVADQLLGRGMQHFLWNGRTSTGQIAANGDYRPQVVFPALHRTLVLPSPIRLDTVPPRLLSWAIHPFARTARFLVHYRFDEPAHVLLSIDGRRVLVTRLAKQVGTVTWLGRFSGGRRARKGLYGIGIAGTDLAGNTSRPTVLRIRLA